MKQAFLRIAAAFSFAVGLFAQQHQSVVVATASAGTFARGVEVAVGRTVGSDTGSGIRFGLSYRQASHSSPDVARPNGLQTTDSTAVALSGVYARFFGSRWLWEVGARMSRWETSEHLAGATKKASNTDLAPLAGLVMGFGTRAHLELLVTPYLIQTPTGGGRSGKAAELGFGMTF